MSALVILAATITCALGGVVPKWDPNHRIVGGDPTTIEAHPYMVSLQFNAIHICGAVILSERFMVTAAHCASSINPDNPSPYFNILSGVTSLDQRGVRHSIRRVHQHPDFDMITLDKDISFIELSQPMVFTGISHPIGLPRDNYHPNPGSTVTVVGWGQLSANGPMAEGLQKVELQVVDPEVCQRLYPRHVITEYMICAGAPYGSKDVCRGDSGGPMIDNGQLVGIVSWGRGCGDPIHPGVYTHVAKLRSFITKVTGI